MALKIHLLVAMPAAYSSKISVPTNHTKTWYHNTKGHNMNISIRQLDIRDTNFSSQSWRLRYLGRPRKNDTRPRFW
jgi:hypothetical protein